ncbi:hypothetical protein E2C01_013413 [Portunus trituberculatus]|uniref:Uncharacterized protein n=1 Tax=Portunus trituberculatus TaxID=210409 RepID=A0A5B7DH12_PORTR|nr:hypothetical protein [Portunus trituberculatus]
MRERSSGATKINGTLRGEDAARPCMDNSGPKTSVIGGTAVQVVRRGGGAGEAKTSTMEAANLFPISVTSRELVFGLA